MLGDGKLTQATLCGLVRNIFDVFLSHTVSRHVDKVFLSGSSSSCWCQMNTKSYFCSTLPFIVIMIIFVHGRSWQWNPRRNFPSRLGILKKSRAFKSSSKAARRFVKFNPGICSGLSSHRVDIFSWDDLLINVSICPLLIPVGSKSLFIPFLRVRV